MDLDQSGHGFQRVRTYLGPSLGWTDELVQPTTEILVSGAYNVKPGDSLLLVDVAATVTINLPDVVRWTQQTAGQPATGFDRSITVKDLGGNAVNFNIVVVPFGQQAIDGIQGSVVISQARAAVKLVPLIDMSGWAVALASTSGGGGGGGGDVLKAGNNTFTGTNTFQSTTTAPTVAIVDDSINVATTAYVRAQGYITSTALASYALIASPVFTGNPQAPTPAQGDNDTSIATTAFVQQAVNSIGIPAPANAEFITSSVNGTLTAERVLTNSASITWDFTVAGQAKANTSAGGGNVSNVGTPVNGQIARWVTSTTIEGVDGTTLYAPIASPTFIGNPQAPTPTALDNDTSIATTAFVQTAVAGKQPLDGDLTSLSALTGTNTIYYRSATDIWSPVTFSGLTFSGGVLTSSAGGNVSNVGTPTNLQIAQWTDATHIQGISIASFGFAPIANPTFTGDPQAPTPATADNDTSIATTAFVKAQSYITAAALASYAPLASPTLTGDPKSVTPSTADNDTSIATTAYVQANLSSYLTTVSATSTYAPLASPTFTGDPKAPTPLTTDNDTSIATTAYVKANLVNFVALGGGGTMTGGLYMVPYNAGALSSGSFTPNAGLGNYQYYTNNGAHTLIAPTADCAIDIMVTNGATAGAITFSGFTVGTTGDPLTTVNTNKFVISIRRINAIATYMIKALQ